MYDIILSNNQTKGAELIEQLKGKKPLFSCVVGVTETAKIQGISAAGANPFEAPARELRFRKRRLGRSRRPLLTLAQQ